MREDPLFSGGLVKVLLGLLVVVAVGFGVFALTGKDVNIDLPDLPEVDATSVTTLENTVLSETTIDGPGEPPPAALADPYSSKGFAAALDEVRGEVGAGAEVTRLFINGTITQFVVRRGKGVDAYNVRADTGELEEQDATISITGNATIADFAFPLDSVQPAAVDRMLAAARTQSGKKDFRPSVLTLERAIPFGSRALRWTINASAGGRYVLYRADADGRNVRNEGGGGVAIPQAAQDAQKLNDCIRAAGSNTDQILACLDRF